MDNWDGADKGTSNNGTSSSSNSTVSTLTSGTFEPKDLSPVYGNMVKMYVKNRLFPACPMMNSDTYDECALHDKICDFLELGRRERLENKDSIKRITLRNVETTRHNAKTAVKKKIGGKLNCSSFFVERRTLTLCPLFAIVKNIGMRRGKRRLTIR